jgi:hypothetical protein
MNHHTNKQYLLENIKIVHHALHTKEGLCVVYEFEEKTFIMMAEPERLTMLLEDCRLINKRRQSSNGWYVHYNGEWILFKYYLPSSYCEADLLLICARHEETKVLNAAIDNISDTSILARMKPICNN